MQKKILSILIGSACCMAATNAIAELDLTVTTPAGDVYINSVVGAGGAAGNIGDIDSGANCDALIKYPFGFSIGVGTSKYVRINLSGATFASAFDTTVGTAVIAPLAADATVTVASGGTEGDDFVILEVNAVNNVAAADTLELDLADTVNPTGLDITSTTGVEVTLATYEFAANAIAETLALSSKSGDLVTFADGLGDVTITDAVSDEINPSDPTEFSAAADILTDLSETKAVLGDTCLAAGTTTTAANLFDDADLVVTGDFSAFPTTATDVFIAPTADNCSANEVFATSVDTTTGTATFEGTVTQALLVPTGYDLCVEDNGSIDMVEGNYACTVTLNGQLLDGEVIADELPCGNLQFAGSSDRVNYGMTPGGGFKQYFRISNPSTTSGAVTVTLVNDAGDPASFDLSVITGDAELTDGASTDPISIDALFASAQAGNPGFDKAGNGKMRVIVRGNFGDDIDTAVAGTTKIFGDANSTDGIIIEAAGVDKSGDGFTLME